METAITAAARRCLCGSRMVFDNVWWCRNCEMRSAADRREAADDAYRALIAEEARDFRRNGP